MSIEKRRGTRPKRSRRDQRAIRSIVSDSRRVEILLGESPERPNHTRAFSVKRSAVYAPRTLFHIPAMKDVMKRASPAKALKYPATPVLPSVEAVNLAREFSGSTAELETSLKKAVKDFPDHLEGTASGAVILGNQRRGSAAPRYIAVVLDSLLGQQILDEHDSILSNFGESDPRQLDRFISHLTLFETRDQKVADRLLREVGEIACDSPRVVLGKAQVDPFLSYNDRARL